MKCPVCASSLVRSQYEGVNVFKCHQCVGYLVQSRRVEDICRRDTNSPEELQQEISQSGDNNLQLRCPRCRRLMDKEDQPGTDSFALDRCRSCEWVWFDSGELARFQIRYEATAQGRDAARFRKRSRQMTSGEQRVFEHNLANLPDGDSSLASAIGDGLVESLRGFLSELLRR
ncbi:zf-TFIIB domain-containing protein [Rhodopirellula bahusiensis]|uniref:Transcription factor zinc-finger domain-containing protein n=1 Tax=Rhodopirellula bahusiensis TaxID=2014065 RepID=A0A2G1W2I6_9BACT|nr:zf-TFIIB domain-containing protein [Rhodopirellula bahusiensis]PHQ32889.1 hypothetical protein CEE69_23120 [Rhodopirellula bahusiensis]